MYKIKRLGFPTYLRWEYQAAINLAIKLNMLYNTNQWTVTAL